MANRTRRLSLLISLNFLGFQFSRAEKGRSGKWEAAHGLMPAARSESVTAISRTVFPPGVGVHHRSRQSCSWPRCTTRDIRGGSPTTATFTRNAVACRHEEDRCLCLRGGAPQSASGCAISGPKGARWDWFGPAQIGPEPQLLAHWQLCHANGQHRAEQV